MLRTLKTKFKTSKENINKLFQLNKLSAQVYNDCLDFAKTYSLVHSGQWINKSELQALTKKNYPMHSQSIQAVAHKYLFSRDSAHKARKKGLKNKYPYKKKNYFNTKWANNGFKINGNTISLSLGVWKGKQQDAVEVKVPKLPKGTIKEIELIYDRGLQLCLAYENGIEPKENKFTNSCGVDLGEIHSIASYCDNGEALIITGRKQRSIHNFRNKKLKELQKLMSKCKKGSRQWKKYNRAKQYILSKSQAQLKDCLHKTTKNFVDWCLANQIKEVVLGKVEGVQRKTKKKLRKTITQKLSNWSFGKLKAYLEYKLSAEGIELKEREEKYTTQQCPCCGRRKKPSSRNYKCICGYQAHRDIHGARNILSKEKHKGKILYIGEIDNIEYKKIA